VCLYAFIVAAGLYAFYLYDGVRKGTDEGAESVGELSSCLVEPVLIAVSAVPVLYVASGLAGTSHF
jgi:hypothetical protein